MAASRPLVRTGMLVLVLAVVFCLALPMAGEGEMAMPVAMLCCFVLVAFLGIALLEPPRQNATLGVALREPWHRAEGVPRLARAPDPIAIGALLI